MYLCLALTALRKSNVRCWSFPATDHVRLDNTDFLSDTQMVRMSNTDRSHRKSIF